MRLQTPARPLKIVIPGGSGHLGQILASRFHAAGDYVTVITRRSDTDVPWRCAEWDGKSLGFWVAAIDGADVVINLAGKSVNCRYTDANKEAIMQSRVLTTQLVGSAIERANRPPTLWLNASTATIYRHAFDRPMDEESGELGGSEPDAPTKWRFSIDVARRWEEAFFESQAPATRKVALRIAIVMSPQRGGTFDLLLSLVRRGLGGYQGSGKQFMSWIHDQDLFDAIRFIIDHDALAGVVNVSSPNPLPNAEFMRILRQAAHARFGLAAPEWLLEIGTLVMGTESELILKSRRVIPRRLADAGFRFSFPQWPTAAKDLVRRWSLAQ